MIKHYSNINIFFDDIQVPRMRNPLFHIMKFEDHNPKGNNNSKILNSFIITFHLGYDASFSIENSIVNALEYNLSFISPGQVSKWQMNEIQSDALSYFLVFKPEFLTLPQGIYSFFETFPFFNNYTVPHFKLTKNQKSKFINILQKIYQEYNKGEEGSSEIIKSYLTIFLFEAKRELEFSKDVSYLRTRAEEITYKFENLIKETRHKREPIKFYADQLNLSSIYLSECVKKITHKTAKQIINEYVILEAKSLLKYSTKSISEIAFSLGFDDNSNFVKYFKKQTGITPKKFKC